jgi:single-strand DNA-binding protein
MASFNRVILLGNLTRDPELRYIASGTAVTELGLAVNDRRKNANGEWVEETTFVDVTLWARTAEVASEYLTKGSPVFIEGRLKFDTWETPEGQKRSKLRVVGERMQLLGGRGGGPAGEGGPPGPGRPARAAAPGPSQAPPPDEGYDMPPPEPSGGQDIPF